MTATFTHAEMAKQAGAWVRRAQHEMDTIHLVKCTIDEAALLFASEDSLAAFLKWAVGQGYQHIGTVERDTMYQRYGNSEKGIPNLSGPAFQVRFEFVRLEGFPFRIEAMCVLDGEAPLHEAALAKYGEGSVVHVSWRAAPNGDSTGYGRHKKALEAEGGHGTLSPLAEYQNTYGRFCYYGEPGRPPYLKPRVNLRDP